MRLSLAVVLVLSVPAAAAAQTAERDDDLTFLRLVVPASVGSATGLVGGFAVGGGDPEATFAVLGALAGSALGAGLGMHLVGAEQPWAPAASGILAGIAGAVLLAGVASLDEAGVLFGFAVGQGVFASVLTAALE